MQYPAPSQKSRRAAKGSDATPHSSSRARFIVTPSGSVEDCLSSIAKDAAGNGAWFRSCLRCGGPLEFAFAWNPFQSATVFASWMKFATAVMITCLLCSVGSLWWAGISFIVVLLTVLNLFRERCNRCREESFGQKATDGRIERVEKGMDGAQHIFHWFFH